METRPNAPAAPIVAMAGNGLAADTVHGFSGLTKREYFAALNHAAILRAAAFNQGAEDMLRKAGIKSTAETEAFLARLAIDAADALICELNIQ